MRRMLLPGAEIGYPAGWWGKTVDVPSALPLSLSSLNSGRGTRLLLRAAALPFISPRQLSWPVSHHVEKGQVSDGTQSA